MQGQTVSCNVQLFGPQAELADAPTVRVDIFAGVTTVADVLAQLKASVPALRESLSASRLAVNHELAEDGSRILLGTEELGLIGMVGGG